MREQLPTALLWCSPRLSTYCDLEFKPSFSLKGDNVFRRPWRISFNVRVPEGPNTRDQHWFPISWLLITSHVIKSTDNRWVQRKKFGKHRGQGRVMLRLAQSPDGHQSSSLKEQVPEWIAVAWLTCTFKGGLWKGWRDHKQNHHESKPLEILEWVNWGTKIHLKSIG